METKAREMAAADRAANPLGLPIGCQTYPVRALIEKDFEGTLKVLAEAGFEEIELCSPVGYANWGFAGLANYSGAEMRRIFGDIGVICESSHVSMTELRDDLAGRIAWAKDLGLTQIITPTLAGPPDPTIDDVKRVADEFNRMGEQCAMAGIQLGLHNEDFELTSVDGERTYDLLFELLDPNLIKFQFQVSTISRGYDAAEYFTKYPGRFFSMHLQDWSASAKKTVAAGQGDLDWEKIFSAAKVGGIQNYFVELKLDDMKASVPYLRALRV
jgi:sugar phosphate isomerase/epimerase